MRQIKRLFLVFMLTATALAMAGCGSNGISGEYLNQDADGVILLQVTQSGDHDLRGSMIATEYSRSGELVHDSATFTGSVNDRQLALIVNGGPESGIVEGDTITLTSPASIFAPAEKTVFKRASHAEYDQAVKDMQQEAPKRKTAMEQKQHEAAEAQAISMQAQELALWVSSHERGDDLTNPIGQARGSLQIAQNDLAAALRSAPGSFEAKRQYANTLVVGKWVAGNISQLNAEIASLQKQIREWDSKIAHSPCRTTNGSSGHCADEVKAERKYATIKQNIEKQIDTSRDQAAKLTNDMNSIIGKAKSHAGE